MIEKAANNETVQTANNDQAAINEIENKTVSGAVMTQAQLDLKTALETVIHSINETLISADKSAFRFAFDIKRCYDLITEYRSGTKDPFYFEGRKYSKVEEFAKSVFGLSKSAFLSKVKIATQFCDKQGLPDPTKTKGLKYSALQDVTADEIAALEEKYNAIEVADGKEKPAFSNLSLKSIRALKNATKVAITAGGIVDAAKILPDEGKTEKAEKKSGNPATSAREKALNAVKAYIESCEDKEELKTFIAEILAIKGND